MAHGLTIYKGTSGQYPLDNTIFCSIGYLGSVTMAGTSSWTVVNFPPGVTSESMVLARNLNYYGITYQALFRDYNSSSMLIYTYSGYTYKITFFGRYVI